MDTEKQLPQPIPENISGDTSIFIGGDVNGNVIVGDNNTVNQTIIQKIRNVFQGGAETQRAMRNRRAMLELVKNIWIKGVLEKSLHAEVLLELGMDERFDSVEDPWGAQLQMPKPVNNSLPAGTSILQAFEEMNGAMLILGGPGSGKTTMLLELARNCIDRAQQDDNRPIPVVFNLSSWDGKQTIDNWLVAELNTKYNIPIKVAQNWVNNDDLQLLLDGLDEVKLKNQELCIKAINRFRQEHGLTVPITVCCRIADYEILTVKLNLRGSVVLRPLSVEQINKYFEQLGTELADIYRTLRSDKVFQEMLEQPLMLSVVTLACQGNSGDIFLDGNLGTIETRRKHLFDTYIKQMFLRVARTKNELYTSEQTTHWLAWLARKMEQRGESIFLIEQMQPTWFDTNLQTKLYGAMTRIVSGMIIGITLAAFIGQINWLLDGLLIGLLYGVVVGLNFQTQKTKDKFNETARLIISTFLIGVVGGLYSCAAYEFRIYYVWGIQPDISDVALHGLIDGVFYGFVGAVFYKLMNKQNGGQIDIETVETLKWTWSSLLTGIIKGLLAGLIYGGFFGVVLGIIFLVYAGLFNNHFNYGFIDGIKTGAGLGLFLGPTVGLAVMLRRSLLNPQVEVKTFPNQGIWLSLRNGILSFLLITISSTALFKLYAILRLGASRTIFYSFTDEKVLFLGISSGIIGFVFLGGSTVIKHLILRIMLAFNGAIPIEYSKFLDYCVEQIFLRRVGGGYIFVHRLLMEYFAAMHQGAN